MEDKQIVDNAITRIEYKISKKEATTDREVVEKTVEIENIKQLKDKAQN